MTEIRSGGRETYTTIQSIAERLGCADNHVVALVREGKLSAVKFGPRALRISESSYEKFISGTIGEIIKKQSSFAVDEPKTKRVLLPSPPVARSAWMSGSGRQVESEGYSGGSCSGGKDYTVTSLSQNYKGDPPENVAAKAIKTKNKLRTILSVE